MGLVKTKASVEAVACPVCGARDFQQAYEEGLVCYGRCGRCGLAYVASLAPDEDPSVAGRKVIRTKDTYNRDLVEGFDVREEQGRFFAPRRKAFYEHLLGRPVCSLLDVGCGSGYMARPWRELGVDYLGLEINPELLEVAHARGLPVLEQDFTEWDDGGAYDVIFSSQVLEHILEPHRYLEQAARFLRPGGLLHLDVPNDNSLTARLRRLRKPTGEYGFLQIPYHLIAYTQASMEHLLQSHPLEVRVLGPYANNHSVFGQTPRGSWKEQLVYALSAMLGMGSLLVLVAQKPDGAR